MVHIVENPKLPYIPPVEQMTDSTKDLAYIPHSPLPPSNMALYICGQPASGKTTLWNSMLLSHPTKKKPFTPRFFWRYFDQIHLVSPSLATLNMKKLRLKEERTHNKFTDGLLTDIVEGMQDDENFNNLIILDDCIRELTKSKILCKCILNRRHCTQNNDEEGNAALSVWICGQKYNGLPLYARCNMSHVIVFRTENRSELTAIKNELMQDLNPDMQDKVLDKAWDKKHGFLYICTTKPTADRYYSNFDKIVIGDEENNAKK